MNTHTDLNSLFANLWTQYSAMSPQVQRIHGMIRKLEGKVINDHIALRTFNHPKLGLESLAREFKKLGYKEKGTYSFTEKKLNAKHYETKNPEDPKVFISELRLEDCSPTLNKIVDDFLDDVKVSDTMAPDLCYKGKLWSPISYEEYKTLSEESEYAAWFSAFGFCANHFTVFINPTKEFKTIRELNDFLKSKGFKLNSSGGEVKGSPQVYLEQSSTMADHTDVEFSDGVQSIPSVYYEFAKRYEKEGQIYQGFVEASADKIFESTNES